jgi:hypothetical protein
MLGYDYFYTCHSFPTRQSPFLFSCDGTCRKWHLSFQVGTMGYLSFTIPSYLFSSPSLWKSCGIIISSLLGFFSNYLHNIENVFMWHLKGTSIKSVGLVMGVWLLTYPTTPAICLFFVHFFTTLRIHLGLQHPIIAYLSCC